MKGRIRGLSKEARGGGWVVTTDDAQVKKSVDARVMHHKTQNI